MPEAYIGAAARTAGGRKGGRLAGWHPANLAAEGLNALVDRTGADPAQIEDVIMGCVMQAGEQSVNIGRNAVLASKLPESVPATSVDRQCGSSQQSIHFAAQAVMSGAMDCVIAASLDGIRAVKLIAEGGRLTAASASQICDGAAGVMIVSEKGLKSLGVKPMARIHHMTLLGHDPVIMLEAPLPATEKALKKAGMT